MSSYYLGQLVPRYINTKTNKRSTEFPWRNCPFEQEEDTAYKVSTVYVLQMSVMMSISSQLSATYRALSGLIG